MRIVGYVRESPGQQEDTTAFVQSERIRRWASDAGHQVVAVCQDVRHSGYALGRDGYRALIGIIGAGQVEAVVVASLAVLSPDKINQEIMIWDLRSRGAAVLSADAEDLDALKEPPADPARLLIRDVLGRIEEHASSLRPWRPTVLDDSGDVVVELIPPSGSQQAHSS